MKQYDISQLPVIGDEGGYAGMVTELDILNHLLRVEQHDPNETISDIVSQDAAAVVEDGEELVVLAVVSWPIIGIFSLKAVDPRINGMKMPGCSSQYTSTAMIRMAGAISSSLARPGNCDRSSPHAARRNSGTP